MRILTDKKTNIPSSNSAVMCISWCQQFLNSGTWFHSLYGLLTCFYLNRLVYIDQRVVCIGQPNKEKNANPQLGVHKNHLPLLFLNQHHFLNLPCVLAISSVCVLYIRIRKATLSAPQHKYSPGRSAELLAPSLLSGTGLVWQLNTELSDSLILVLQGGTVLPLKWI